ncbi:DUF1573 domain-containing protein [Xanthocytophaga agilis]|uniref:DUF1573 domain-containing protein n=1 Tax=Xanthocytophaga agilis TaxID=3048010 RepID=A0AAE3R9E9_9BACT|nr:DUF1573 domain-containing protein [Xanthocytophaga agilis]MDJ1503982.1 DUF1573 domain-containing protein [Xanthocytophaga agilis]
MRKILICSTLLAVLIVTGSCSKQTDQGAGETVVAASEAPYMKFDEASFDFGAIEQGAVVTHTFAFTNTGKTPLIIERAVASCGCTVPDWPRKPVPPGAKSEIKVEFNSQGKAGPQQKTITVYANTQPKESKVVLVGVVNAVQNN